MKRILLSASALLAMYGVSAQTVIYQNDFNGGSPLTGWTQQTLSTDGGWLAGTATALSSQYWPITSNGTNIVATNDDGCNCNKSADRLVSPSISIPAGGGQLFVDVFFNGGTYQGATETCVIEISTNGGTSWTNLRTLTGAADWRNEAIDLAAYSGQNVLISFLYNDGGGWLFGAAIDNFRVVEPAARDLAMTNLNMLTMYGLNNAPIAISGSIQNLGSSAVTSFTLNYTVNGGAPVTQNVTGVNIAPLATYSFTHSTNWNPTMTGTYAIAVSTSNPNGQADLNTANDAMTRNIQIVTASALRTVLFEQFTSSTCAPCASAAPTIATTLNNNQTNTTGRVAAIKYHMNYPSPGTDPTYNSYSNTRHTYYGVSGIPHAQLDGPVYGGHPTAGGAAATLTQAKLDERKAMPAFVNLPTTAYFNGGNLVVETVVQPLADISSSNLRLHMVVVEDVMNNLTGTTSQTTFRDVQRSMMTNASGNNVPALSAGNNVTVTQNRTFTLSSAPAANQTTNLSSTFANVTVIVFLQDNTTREVYQANYIKPTFLSLNDKEASLPMELFPNPANDYAQLVLDIQNNSEVEVMVLDMAGKMVFNITAAAGQGVQSLNIPTFDLPSGMYMVRVMNEGKVGVKSLMIAH
jgi:hypothetical protein